MAKIQTLPTAAIAAAPRIAVLGGGVAGVTAAYALQTRGYEVTLYDRQRYAAMETSFANGGQLSASNAEVWTHPSTVMKGLKWLFQRDAPLLFNLKPSLAKLRWCAGFLANMGDYRRNTIETAKLAIAARRPLLEWAEREGLAFDCERRGIMHVYRDPKSLAHAEQVNRLLAEAGLERRALTPEQIREIEPRMHGEFVGGFFTESDFNGDIHLYAKGLAAAAERHGAEIRYEADVSELTHLAEGGVAVGLASGERFAHDAVVIAAGADSSRLAAQLGERVTVYPVKGYSITVELDGAASRAAAPWVSLLDDETKIVSSRLGDDRFRVAGTAEINGWNRDIRADRIQPLVDWVQRHFPGVSTETSVPWAGLRPMTPSMMPKVGPGRTPNVFFHTGHGHLGWTLSAGTAEILAESVAQQMPAPRPMIAGRVAEAA